MPTIFIGLLALALVLWLAKSFARVDPKYMIRVGRTAGGIVALAGAAFLGARGELAVALPLGVTGLGLLGWAPAGWWPDQKSPGQASQVRSNFLSCRARSRRGNGRFWSPARSISPTRKFFRGARTRLHWRA